MNQPRTVLVPNEENETVHDTVEQLDNEFPMVHQNTTSAKGVGVLLVETERSLQSTVDASIKMKPDILDIFARI